MMTLTAFWNRLTRWVIVSGIVLMVSMIYSPTSWAAGLFSKAPAKVETPVETSMPSIEKAAEDVVTSKPMSMREVQARTQNGAPNEIQGTADAGKMFNDSQPNQPDNILARKIDQQVRK
jgi:hypothetical protein